MTGISHSEIVLVIILYNVLNFLNNATFVYCTEDELCFSVIGDIGGMPHFPYQTTNQKKVAKLLAQMTEKTNSKFVVGLGDNFYFSGVHNVTDPRFYFTYERTYSAKSLNIPWYMIAGNHDHVSNVTAQIKYSEISNRWNFPDFYYTKVFEIPNSKKTFQLVMIDTTMLCWYNKRSNSPSPEEQLQWIENTLKKSSSSFVIVAGHHPVFSSGSHGNTECLVKLLKPLLEKYAVSAYFSGHDHNLQYIREKNMNVHYFISGSGNFVDGNFHKAKLPMDSTSWREGDNGFIMVCATPDKLKLNIYKMDRESPIISFEILPRKNILEDRKKTIDDKPNLNLLLSQLYHPIIDNTDVSNTGQDDPIDLTIINNLKLKNISSNQIENADKYHSTNGENFKLKNISSNHLENINKFHKAINKPRNFQEQNTTKQKISRSREKNEQTSLSKTPKRIAELPTMLMSGKDALSKETSFSIKSAETCIKGIPSLQKKNVKQVSSSESIDINSLSNIPLSSYGTLPSDSTNSDVRANEQGKKDSTGNCIFDFLVNKLNNQYSTSADTASKLEQNLVQTKPKDNSKAKALRNSAEKKNIETKSHLHEDFDKQILSTDSYNKLLQTSLYPIKPVNGNSLSNNVYMDVPYYYNYIHQLPLYYAQQPIISPIPTVSVVQSVYNSYYWNYLKGRNFRESEES